MRTLEECMTILQEAMGRVLRNERIRREIAFTTFCYENGIAPTTMNSIELGKNNTGFATVLKIGNDMRLSSVKLMELLEEELPEGFWYELYNAESEKEKQRYNKNKA